MSGLRSVLLRSTKMPPKNTNADQARRALKDRTERERMIGDKYLRRWEWRQHSQPLKGTGRKLAAYA